MPLPHVFSLIVTMSPQTNDDDDDDDDEDDDDDDDDDDEEEEEKLFFLCSFNSLNLFLFFSLLLCFLLFCSLQYLLHP